jgi:hypothetical protein
MQTPGDAGGIVVLQMNMLESDSGDARRPCISYPFDFFNKVPAGDLC